MSFLIFFFYCISTLPLFADIRYDAFIANPTLKEPWNVTQSTTFDGSYRAITIESRIHIAPHTTLTLKNCTLKNITNETLQFADNSSTLVLQNCSLLLADNYQWRQGSIIIKSFVEIRGPHVWHHMSNNRCTIEKNSTLLCSENLLYYYDPTKRSRIKLMLSSNTSTLMLHKAHLRSGSGGLLLTKGNVCIHETCSFHAENKDVRRGIDLGTGLTSHDNVRLILANSQSKIRISQPHLYDKSRNKGYFWRALPWICIGSIGAYLGTQ